MSITTTKHLPLHNECSGIANLDARSRRPRRVMDVTRPFCTGMVVGAMIVWLLVLIFTK